MPVFQPYTCRDIRKATGKPENEHRRSRNLEGRKSYRAYNLSQDICPQFRRRPISQDPRARSACLQIDFIRGGDFHEAESAVGIHGIRLTRRSENLPRAENRYGSPFLSVRSRRIIS